MPLFTLSIDEHTKTILNSGEQKVVLIENNSIKILWGFMEERNLVSV